MNNRVDGQFKATKLWNQITYDFSCGIKLKKQRRNLRNYDHCFVAYKAVDWLHCYLINLRNLPIQDKPISREQAIQLLDKFLLHGIIERVTFKGEGTRFKDNKDLYRLKRENIPLPQVENSKNDVNKEESEWHVTECKLNQYELSELWQRVIFSHIRDLVPSLELYVNINDFKPMHTLHNVTKLSQKGVVLLNDKSEDIPHWVMSAMKCIANWPNKERSNQFLPKYPDFEKDVFNLIREHFVHMNEPLIPKCFYFLFASLVREEDLNKPHHGQPNRLGSIPIRKEFSTPCKEGIYETMFLSGSPITRMVSYEELESFFSTRDNHKSNPLNDETDVRSVISSRSTVSYQMTMPRIAKKRKTNELRKIDMDNEYYYNNLGYINLGFILQSPPEEGQYMMNKSVTPPVLLPSSKDPLESTRSAFDLREAKLIKLINLSLILMPPPNRRSLHILLCLLNRIIKNKELKIFCKDSRDVEEYLIRIFSRCIIFSGNEKTYNEKVAQHIISVMIHNTEAIFCIQRSLRNQVKRLSENANYY